MSAAELAAAAVGSLSGLAIGLLVGFAHGRAQRSRVEAAAYGRGVWEGRRAERRARQEDAARRMDFR